MYNNEAAISEAAIRIVRNHPEAGVSVITKQLQAQFPALSYEDAGHAIYKADELVNSTTCDCLAFAKLGGHLSVNANYSGRDRTVTYVNASLETLDPFQPMDHETDVYAGEIPREQRARWYVIRHCDDCMATAMGERSCCAFHFAPYEAAVPSRVARVARESDLLTVARVKAVKAVKAVKMSAPARPCTAHDLTWHATGGQCLNCGATASATYLVKHVNAINSKGGR